MRTMAKRKISNARRSRYSRASSRGSGYLDPDTGILGDEQTFWWKNLEDNTIVRHSAGSELGNQTSQYLNASSRIDSSNAEDGWWKPLENSDISASTKIVTENTRNTKPVRSYVKSTSESEEEDKIVKRKLPLRAVARRSRNSNAFVKALDSSSGSNLTEPVQTRREKSSNNSRLHAGAVQHPGTHLITPQDSSDNQSHTTDIILKSKPKILGKKNLISGNNNFHDAVKEGASSSPSKRTPHRISKAGLSRMLIENKGSPISHRRNSRVLDFENNESSHWPPPTAQSTIIEQPSLHNASKTINDNDSDTETYRLKRMALNRNRRSITRNPFENILEDELSAAEKESRKSEEDGVAVNVDRQALVKQNLIVQLEDIRKLSKSGSNNMTNIALENKQSSKGAGLPAADKNSSVSSSSRRHENRSITQKNLLLGEDSSGSASDLNEHVSKPKSQFLRSARKESQTNKPFLNVSQDSEHNTSKTKLLQSRASTVSTQGRGRLTANISGVETLENIIPGTSPVSKIQASRQSSKNKTHRESSSTERISVNADDISFSTSESIHSRKNSRVINDSTLSTSKYKNNVQDDIDYSSNSEARSRSNIIPETLSISKSQASRHPSKSKTHSESARSVKISENDNDDILFSVPNPIKLQNNSRLINSKHITSKQKNNIEDGYISDDNTSSKSDITDDGTESHVSPNKKSRQDFARESHYASHKRIEFEEDSEGNAQSSKHRLLDGLGDDLNDQARASPILGRLSNDRKSHRSKRSSKTRQPENNQELENELMNVSRASINSRKSQALNRTDQRKNVKDNQYLSKTGNEEIIPNSQVVENVGQADKENRSIVRKHSRDLSRSQKLLTISDSESHDDSKEDSDNLSTSKNKIINKSSNHSAARISHKAVEDSPIRASNKLRKRQKSIGALSSDDGNESDEKYPDHSKSRNKILDKPQSRPVTRASSISHRDVPETPSSRSSRRIKILNRSQNMVSIHDSDDNDQNIMTVPNLRDNDDSFEELQDPLRRETRSLRKSRNRSPNRIPSTVQDSSPRQTRSSSRLQGSLAVNSKVHDDSVQEADNLNSQTKSKALSKSRNEDRDVAKKYRRSVRQSHKQLASASPDDKADSNEETQQISEKRKVSNELQKRSVAIVMEDSDEAGDQNIEDEKESDLNRSKKSLNAPTLNQPDEGNLNLSKAESSTSRKSRTQPGSKASGSKVSQGKGASFEINKSKNSSTAQEDLLDVLTHDDSQFGNEDVLENLAKVIRKSRAEQPEKEKDRSAAEMRKSSVARGRTTTQVSDHLDEVRRDSGKVSSNNNTMELRLSALVSSEPDNEENSTRDEEPGSRGLNYSPKEVQQAVSRTQIADSGNRRISTIGNKRINSQERKDTSNQLEKGKKSVKKKGLSKIGSDTNTSKIQKNLDNFFKVTTTSQLSATNLTPGTSASQDFADNPKMQDIKKELEKIKEQELSAMKAKPEVHKVKLPVIGNQKKLAWKPNPKSQTKHHVDKAYMINGQVYKPPKLPRPKPWATDRLYRHLWKRMEPVHKLETRVRSEKFVQQLAQVMALIMKCKKYEKYENDLNSLMKEMARLGIVETRQDFYHFCQEFLPYEFRIKAIPMSLPGNETSIPYDPQTLHQPILQSQTDN